LLLFFKKEGLTSFMANLATRERLQPSLLDRLTDHNPEVKRENLEQQTLSMQALRQAVLRDLAWLLNSTNLATTDDLDGAPLAAASTLNYGIPGFTGMIASSTSFRSLESAIEHSIRLYEPRIKPETLRVTAREQDGDNPLPALVFLIEGELWAQPVPQQLFLETSIEIETRLAIVTDAARASGRG
jgi:type VI secretion system protein ImpF